MGVNFSYTGINGDQCYVSGILNNSVLYEVTCETNSSSNIFIVKFIHVNNIHHNQHWICRSGNTAIQKWDFFIAVPVSALSISPNTALLTIAENSTIVWQCKSSECRPMPKFRWHMKSPYGNSSYVLDTDTNENSSDVLHPYTSNFSMTFNRTWNNWFLSCGANNKNDTTFVMSANITMNVTYPPDGPPKIRHFEDGNKVVSNVNVIIGGFVNLECSVSGGNPLPRLEWNINNDIPQTVAGIIVRKNISWPSTTIDVITELKCQSIHDLIDTSYVRVNVLYPPETPVITVKTISGSYVKVNITLDVIEGTPYTVNCSSKSNPQVSLFKWNGLPPSSSPLMYVEKADRGHDKTVTCNVSNVMQISDTTPTVTGMNITNLKVNVLYPPKVSMLRGVTIIEGEEIDYTCNFTPGNPGATNITWSWKGSLWDGQHIQLKNVSRNQAGVYICSLHNIMAASDGRREHGNSSGTFYLSVQYKTKILKFVVNDIEKNQVTFSENDTVNMSCEIEGDPLPTGELLHQKSCCNLQEQQQPFTASQQLSHLRLSSVFRALCSDTGVQTCIGSNTFYNGIQSTSNKSISLFVNCSPRKYSSFEVKENVTSVLNATATFHFTAMAYPQPNFQWYQIINGVATSEAMVCIIESSTVSTNVMQIMFTLEHVEESHYGEYLLILTNQYGTFQQRFYLIPEELELTETPAKSKSVGPAVGGAVGGLLAVVTVTVSLVIVRKRSIGKRTRAQNKACDLNDLHTYQNFQNDGYSPSEGSSSAVYERLQHPDSKSDQQYQQLATFSEKDRIDGPNQRVYENLKLSQQNKANNVGSCGSCQNTPAHT